MVLMVVERVCRAGAARAGIHPAIVIDVVGKVAAVYFCQHRAAEIDVLGGGSVRGLRNALPIRIVNALKKRAASVDFDFADFFACNRSGNSSAPLTTC